MSDTLRQTLGPPAPVAAPAFAPIPQTSSVPAPLTSIGYTPDPTIRQPGTDYTSPSMFHPRDTGPYVPPAWAQQLQVGSADYAAAQGNPAAAQGYRRPGLPDRVNLNPFGDNPVGQFLGGDAGVALGLVPGTVTGGVVPGTILANAPVTMANFATWNREGALAALLFLSGSDYQHPASASFGEQPTGPAGGGGPLDWAVQGLRGAGDLAWQALAAPMKYMTDSNAFNRGKDVRNLFQGKKAEPYLIEAVTTTIFGGQERFTMDGLRTAAARGGMDLISTMASRFDLTPEQIAAISLNPYMTDEELGHITDGSPISQDAVSNLLWEAGAQLAMLGVGGAGIGKAAASLGKLGAEGVAGAFNVGMRGAKLAEGADAAAQAARIGGFVTRRVLQLNSLNTTAGWSIRGAEWGIKQVAVIAGNDELVKVMDRMMQQMPLSMNPGWQLIDGFSSHPIDALRNLKEGQIAIGRLDSPGYVGHLDLKPLALRDAYTGDIREITVAGRVVKLSVHGDEFKTLGRLADLTPDDMHAQFFSRLGYSRADLEKAYGEGSDLTWNDLRNTLFHVALQTVREAKGEIGRMEGLHLPTMSLRTAEFIRANAKGAFKVLDDNLKGRSSSMIDTVKGQFWDFAARNDSAMAGTKAPLGAYDPGRSLMDLISWTRASKTLRTAIEQGHATENATLVFRRDVNREYLAAWSQKLAQHFQPDEVVPLAFVNELKKQAGAVELRGKGNQLIKRGSRDPVYTRSQLETIVADVVRADDEFRRAAGAVDRTQAAAYHKGFDPGVDPMEDARVLGIPPSALEAIRTEQARPTHPTPPPARLLAAIAKQLGRTVDDILKAGPEGAWATVFTWLDDAMAAAAETSKTTTFLTDAAKALNSRSAARTMAASVAAAGVAGLVRIRDELLTPLDRKLASGRPGLYQAWQETAAEGIALAEEFNRHLIAPESRMRTAPVKGVQHVLPAGVSGEVLSAYQTLIDKALSEGSPALTPADRAVLEDAALHPLLKDAILAKADVLTAPADRTLLAELHASLGDDPEGLMTAMVNDAGLDPAALRESVTALAGNVARYLDQGADLSGRAAQLARRFQTLGGTYTPEMVDTLDRIADADLAHKAAQKKAGVKKPESINNLPLDPEEIARRAEAGNVRERANIEQEVRRAEKQVADASTALARPYDPNLAAGDDVTWESHRSFGGRQTSQMRQDAAHAEAARLFREGERSRAYRNGNGTWQVDIARPASAVPEVPPVRATPDLLPTDTMDAVTALVDRVYSGKDDAFALIEGTALRDGLLADPAYAPEEMARMRTYLTDLRERMGKDASSVRSAQIADWADNKLAELAKRDVPRETARAPVEPPPPVAAPEPAPVVADAPGPRFAASVRYADGTAGGMFQAQVRQPDGAWARIGTYATKEEANAAWASAAHHGGYRTVGRKGFVERMASNPRPGSLEAAGPTGSFPDPISTEPAVPTGVAVVEAGDLITSADPGFDPSLQPRMRGTRLASDEQIANIEKNLRPGELLGMDTGAQGTPVVTPEGLVIAGNGRVTGIRGATEASRAAYRAAVDAEAVKHGLSTEGMKNPVLIRVVDVPHETQVRLAVHLNFDTGMPPADRAMGLSRLVTDGDLARLSVTDEQSLVDALRSGANDDFVQRFLGHIPDQHRGSYMAPGGGLNEDGVRLVTGTLVARLMGNVDSPVAQQLMVSLFESDPEVRTLASGMDAAGMLIAAQAESAGRTYASVIPSFAADLVPALQRVFAMKGPGLTMRDVRTGLMSVGELFGSDLTPLTEGQQRLAINLTMMRSASEFRRFLKAVAGSVRHSDADQVSLFGGSDVPPPSYPGVVNGALQTLNRAREEGDQFHLLPGDDGVVTVRDSTGAETARQLPVADSAPDVLAGLIPDAVDLTWAGNGWADAPAAIAGSTGKVMLHVDSAEVADSLRAFLGGDDAAMLPDSYRVMEDGSVESMGADGGAMAAQDALRAALKDREWEVTTERPTGAPRVESGRPRTMDPAHEDLTGLSADGPLNLSAIETGAAGEHTVVMPGDEANTRAHQKATGGALNPGDGMVIELHAPSAAERASILGERLSAAQAALGAAKGKLAALPADASPPMRDILAGPELDLYHRYVAQSGAAPLSGSARQPRTVGEVMDLLASLDIGMPPLVGTMKPEEMETLRTALLRVLHGRLNDVAPAQPSRRPGTSAGFGARRLKRAPTVGTIGADGVPVMTTPEDLSMDLGRVMRELQGRINEDGDPLAGWEGTQYEIGAMPTKGLDGGPLAPRIPGGEDWLSTIDAMVPTLGDELLHGRKQAWPEREADAHFGQWLARTPPGAAVRQMRRLGDIALGSRPERVIIKQAIDRFTEDVLRHFEGDEAARNKAVHEVAGVLDAWHEGMKNADNAGYSKYRRVGLVPANKMRQWAEASFKENGTPEWYTRLVAEAAAKGEKEPLSQAWRQADNRVRAFFSEQPGGMSKMLDTVYESRLGKAGHDFGRNLTVGYHISRFVMDLRWLGLEAVESPTLVAFREGIGAMMEGLGKGPDAGKSPMFMGLAATEQTRNAWAWWLAQAEPGTLLRARERFVIASVRRYQQAEFPRVLMEAARRSPDLEGAIRAFDGGNPMEWLKKLDADWEMGARRGQPLTPADAERMFKPWLERGTISQQDYAEFLKAGRYTGHPLIDAEIARVADPRLTPLLERLQAVNEQGWNDAARLVFGQTDRSNLQRLMNHPLLYWPVSYQIKAAKWLGGLLMDRAFGVDTGSLGLVTLGQLHEKHKELMASDPQYALSVSQNPTLLFIAQMLFPVTPWDLGVGLSPFTRLLMDIGKPPGEGYSRNWAGMGSGYTYFSMLPRLFYEQSKPGSWGQDAGVLAPIFMQGQRIDPYSIPVKPTTSQVGSSDRSVGKGAAPTADPWLEDFRSRLGTFNADAQQQDFKNQVTQFSTGGKSP